MPDLKFDKSTIPDLSGRVVLITGGTGGIGAELTVELAQKNPKRILFTGRNANAAEKTLERVRQAASSAAAEAVTFVPCDLASLESVRAAADQIQVQCDGRLDLFLANAGIMAHPAGLSPDGYEVHFATNHLGHALLTQKLLPLLEQTADSSDDPPRVIYTTSMGWKGGNLDFRGGLRTTQESALLGRWVRYCNSKLANMLYARELARRHPKLICFSVHPGVVSTGLSIEQGGFYEPVGVLSSEKGVGAKGEKYANQLWEYTEKELENSCNR
ncbi:oxidoreductase- short-chain dehydrogenase/reductase family [Apiospora sp. TS-2023a]